VAQKNDDALFFINELFDCQEDQSYGLTTVLRGSDDEVGHVGFDLEQLLLEISSDKDLQFGKTGQDGWIVPEEVTQRFFLLHDCC